MDKLSGAIYDLVKDQHPTKIRSLCSRFRSTPLEKNTTLKGFFNTDKANILLSRVLKEWDRKACSSDEIAGLLAGVSFGYQNEKKSESVELVWTGPDLNQLPVRRSEQVLLDVINRSVDSLFIVSFVLINIPTIEAAIKKAVERGVDVRMLIESEDKASTSDFLDSVTRIYKSIPGIILYVWPRERREDTGGGFARVHAKCIVADKDVALVTSANLTSAALDKNIEMGVLVSGGSVPLDIHSQVTAMINSKEIVPYAVSNITVAAEPKEPVSIPVNQLADALLSADMALVHFMNEKLNIEEVRVFGKCDKLSEKPKKNSFVVVEHDKKLMIGKYSWSLQQDLDNTHKFYLVSIRGVRAVESFNILEEEWEDFFPIAVEVNQ